MIAVIVVWFALGALLAWGTSRWFRYLRDDRIDQE